MKQVYFSVILVLLIISCSKKETLPPEIPDDQLLAYSKWKLLKFDCEKHFIVIHMAGNDTVATSDVSDVRTSNGIRFYDSKYYSPISSNGFYQGTYRTNAEIELTTDTCSYIRVDSLEKINEGYWTSLFCGGRWVENESYIYKPSVSVYHTIKPISSSGIYIDNLLWSYYFENRCLHLQYEFDSTYLSSSKVEQRFIENDNYTFRLSGLSAHI